VRNIKKITNVYIRGGIATFVVGLLLVFSQAIRLFDYGYSFSTMMFAGTMISIICYFIDKTIEKENKVIKHGTNTKSNERN